MKSFSRTDITVWYALIAVLFAMDRVFKALALAGAQFGRPRTLEFSLFRNYGIAFSLPLPSILYWIIVPALLVAFVAFTIRLHRHADPRAHLALLVIAGAASNMMDRAAHDAVIDYVIFAGVNGSQGAVNLADGMVIFGLLGLIKTPRTPALGSGTAPSAL